jgi:PAS domain S-box-containing protein
MALTDTPQGHRGDRAPGSAGDGSSILESREYLQCLLSNSEDMIFLLDPADLLVSFSSGGVRLLGYSWEELASSPIRDIVVEDRTFEEMLKAARVAGKVTKEEVGFRHRQGHTVVCRTSLISLKQRSGELRGTLGICRDRTAWEKIKDDLIKIERLAVIGRMASSIIHEISNPLAVINEISGWLGVVVGDAHDLTQKSREELETAIRRLDRQTGRCKNIVRQVLEFARDPTPTRTSFDLHELLREAAAFLRSELKDEEIRLEFILCQGPLLVHSDRKMIEQVFVNLITNAIHAIKEKRPQVGRIALQTVRLGHRAQILVSDNGIGIANTDRERVFELFYTTKPPGTGTGLGLPICRSIVKKLGGDFGFESRRGEGTTFTVQIPMS